MDEQNKKPTEQDRLHNRKFLALYIIGLFSVALVLIVLSYVAQVQSEQRVQSLNQQLGEQTTVAQGAQERADQLQQQYEQLQEQFQALENQMADTQDTLSQKEKQVQALEVFWKIEQAFLQENIEQCRKLIDYLEQNYPNTLTGDALVEYQLIRQQTGYDQ